MTDLLAADVQGTPKTASEFIDGWVHRRDKETIQIQNMETMKRKLRAAAYTSRGVDYKTLFNVYDSNNNQALGLSEFHHALHVAGKVSNAGMDPMWNKKGGGGLSHLAIDQIFRAIDTDHSGSIEYEEFVTWLNASTSPALSPRQQQKQQQQQPQHLTAGQFAEIQLESAQKHKWSKDLEQQRNTLVEQWWQDLYGSTKGTMKGTKKDTQSRKERKNKNTKKQQSSLVGGQREDPVFTRLYPYKFANRTGRVGVESKKTAAAAAAATAAARHHPLDWHSVKKGAALNTRESERAGHWNTNTLVVKHKVSSARRFSVI